MSAHQPSKKDEGDFLRIDGFDIHDVNPESEEPGRTPPGAFTPPPAPVTPPHPALTPPVAPATPQHPAAIPPLEFDTSPGESVFTDQITGTDESDPTHESSPSDSPELVMVRALAGSMAKAVKAVQLYPPENPMCKNFAAVLMKHVNDTFQVVDTIRLSVGKTKLFYLAETVLEQEGRDESVPGRLFWAGVREISFHVGITAQRGC